MRARALTILTSAAVTVSLALPIEQADAFSRSRTHHFKTSKTWTVPWQLGLISMTSRAKGERTIVVRLPKYGKVRGTTAALRYVFAPLPKPKPAGRNTLVAACRTTVARSARRLGAVRVDAASAGPERRTRHSIIAPVGFRLIYASLNGRENYEVRQSVLTCQATRKGKIVNAYV